ncbi:amidohydrolase [Siphonobacter sp. SORGH_AS_0500]|uniref:amidohydrolase n=1 Tax=Siphonobacter sp. SORGH_AS_0500 TaxID=1864824 RepID=UPI00285F2EFA|nr:amidohydrolase [Siphonobacter sp. SORGH_AS_0500]MDR6193598.1 aminobenzoyl-glutamate utilization protein B [Siphonobacter sp. SORGH_AS_0500]
MNKQILLSFGMLALTIGFSQAQADKQKVISSLQDKTDYYGAISKKIWDYAEVGYQETKSSALLQAELKKAGFSIESGVAGIPTAFIATYGSGKPVISILAEYDALPGLAQEATPERKVIEGQRAGHACGHHLFGTGSSAAAIAVKDWLKQSGKTGTIKLIGTPAEEGGSGKVYLVRDGIFNDTDVALHWHPGDANAANPSSSLANISGKFRFKGIAAHAAAAPERGRSALDGVEAMNDMVNMMREHIPQDTRIHYIITKGGEAPNVVPDFAEVYYYARHKDRSILQNVWKRITKAAEGAALGTETQMELEVIGGVYNLLSVDALSSVMHKNLEAVGGFTYTPAEQQFADKISETFGASFGSLPKRGTAQQIAPYSAASLLGSASTDVGDVSWVVPTVGLTTATWVPGTAAHSWQAVAAGGTSIGVKGMMVAAKTLALTAIDLYNDPSLVKKAKEEWEELRGKNFKYEALLGDRKPALDYRK